MEFQERAANSDDLDKTERALIAAVTDRRASHHPIGDGALWSATPG